MSTARRLIPYAGFDPNERPWGGQEPSFLAWWSPTTGPKRRPAHTVRSKTVALSLTPQDRDFIRDEARRRGIADCRLLGDLVEVIIQRRLFDALLGADDCALGREFPGSGEG